MALTIFQVMVTTKNAMMEMLQTMMVAVLRARMKSAVTELHSQMSNVMEQIQEAVFLLMAPRVFLPEARLSVSVIAMMILSAMMETLVL